MVCTSRQRRYLQPQLVEITRLFSLLHLHRPAFAVLKRHGTGVWFHRDDGGRDLRGSHAVALPGALVTSTRV
jgi:hypothetical protein